MQRIIFPVLIILIVTPITGFAQQTKISLKKGQKYKVETSTKMTGSTVVMGDTIESNTDSKTTRLYQIIKTGKKTVELQASITKLVETSTTMGQEYNYDSDKKDNEGPMAGTLSKMINKTKNITINTKGNISRQDEDSSSVSSGIPEANTFTTELFIPALIGKKLEAGDSFTDITTNSKDKYNQRDSGTYTISSLENGVALISYSGTQVINAVIKQMGMEMTSICNTKVVAVIHLDVKTGLILVKASVTDLSMSMEADGITIPLIGKETTTSTISPVQ